MSPSAKPYSVRSSHAKCSVIAALALSLSACSTLPQDTQKTQPLAQAMCPDLPKLSDDTFGAWVAYAVEVVQQYRKCQAAVIGDGDH